MNIKEKQIILIGPVCAGKTTLGKLVSEGLNKESISLDEIAGKYYKENGFVFSEYKELGLTKGKLAAYQYLWSSLAHAAKKVVQDYPNSVIGFGAGYSHYENVELFESKPQVNPTNPTLRNLS